MKRTLFLVLIGALTCSRANAEIINGDFETGNLNGWFGSGGVSVQSGSPYPGGNHHAKIDAVPLGAPGGLTQIFSIATPSLLSFQYYLDVTGPAFVSYGLIKVDTLEPIVLIAEVPNDGENVSELFDPPDFIPSFEYKITQPGSYAFVVLANAKNGGAAHAELDNVKLLAVPEPSAWAMALGGVAALICCGRSRMRTTLRAK